MESHLSDFYLRMRRAIDNIETNRQTNKSGAAKRKRKRDADIGGEKVEFTPKNQLTSKISKSYVRIENCAVSLDEEYTKTKRRITKKATYCEKDLKYSLLVQNLLALATEIEQNVGDALQRKEKEIEKLCQDHKAFKKETFEAVAKLDSEYKLTIGALQPDLEEAKKNQNVGIENENQAEKEITISNLEKGLAEKETTISKQAKELAEKVMMISKLDKELAGKDKTISKLIDIMDPIDR